MRRLSLYCITVGLLAVSALAACAPSATPTIPQAAPTADVSSRDLQIVTGQVIYVPAYSEVYSGVANQRDPLGVTLAIHNTDTDAPIIVTAVRYYDTDGNLIRDYAASPVTVNALATLGFIVEARDVTGGWGANFIVEWAAETPVYEPVVEAIMVSTRGTHGVSFISVGRVLETLQPATPVPALTAEAD